MSVNMKSTVEREALRNYINDNIMESKEAIEMLGFSRERLRQLVSEGRIKTIRKGLYLKDDILAFIDKRKKEQ